MAGELTGLVAGFILVLCYAGQELSRAGWRRTAAKFAGCKSYSIRHTLARELRKRRVPTEQISLFLGHLPSGVAATTSIYAPYDPGFLSDAMATIKDVMRELRGLLKRTRIDTPFQSQEIPASLTGRDRAGSATRHRGRETARGL